MREQRVHDMALVRFGREPITREHHRAVTQLDDKHRRCVLPRHRAAQEVHGRHFFRADLDRVAAMQTAREHDLVVGDLDRTGRIHERHHELVRAKEANRDQDVTGPDTDGAELEDQQDAADRAADRPCNLTLARWLELDRGLSRGGLLSFGSSRA